MARATRYGNQPISELLRMRGRDLADYYAALMDLVKLENQDKSAESRE